MSRRDEIVARMGEIQGEMERLGQYDRPTRTQERQVNSLAAEFADLVEEQREIDVQRIRGAIGGNGALKIESGTPYGDPQYARLGDIQDGPSSGPRRSLVRGRALDLIERHERSAPYLTRDALERATRAVERDASPFDAMAQWVLVAGDDDYRSAFAKLMADPLTGGHTFTTPEREAFTRAQYLSRAMSLTDSAGGYLVPFSLDPSVIVTSSGSANPIRRLARVVTIATDTWNGVSSAGVTAEWKAEAAEVADATPTLGQPSIPVYFGDAFVPFSFEVQGDAMNLEAELGRLMADAREQLEAVAFISGTGVGQPTGITTALDGTSSEIAAGTADTIDGDDVRAVQAALPPRFSARAQWITNLEVRNLLYALQGTADREFPELANDRLLGKPWSEASHLDSPGDTAAAGNDFMLVYGDWSNYVVVDRVGTVVELVPHLVGSNRRPTGQRGLLSWYRVGADSVNDAAFRMLSA